MKKKIQKEKKEKRKKQQQTIALYETFFNIGMLCKTPESVPSSLLLRLGQYSRIQHRSERRRGRRRR
jgi:hypothetical protein